MKGIAAVGVSLALFVLWAAPSSAADDAEISRAVADPAWATGSFAGTVTWGVDCGPIGHIDPAPGYRSLLPSEPWSCGWVPFVTVGPGASPADCSAEGRASPDEPGSGVTLVWVGEEQSEWGTVAFDVPEVDLPGTASPLLCVTAIESQFHPALCLEEIATGDVSCPVGRSTTTRPRSLASAIVVQEEASDAPDLPDQLPVQALPPQSLSTEIPGSAQAPPAAAKKKPRNERGGKKRHRFTRGPWLHERQIARKP